MKNSETITVFTFNHRVLHINIDDVTHGESLAAPSNGGSSINWILGHLCVSRDGIFESLGMPRKCSAEMRKIYDQGTQNVSRENALDIKELLKMLDDTQKPLTDKIAETDYSAKPDALKSLTFLAFHEAYHCGQTGILRRVAGKEGAIK